MIESILDYLLIRSQVMTLSDEALIALYEYYGELPLLYALKEVLAIDDFVLLDDEYINRVLNVSNHLRFNTDNSEIKGICNDIITSLNCDLSHYNEAQKLALREAYLEKQRLLHKIDKYEEHFGVAFFKELLKDEYCNFSAVSDGISMGCRIYDVDGNVLREVDIVKEKDSIDLPALGIGENDHLDTYWYLSSYNFTFSMCFLVDSLRREGELNTEMMVFIKTLLELAERDKKVNRVNYLSDDDFEPSTFYKTNISGLEPFINVLNGVTLQKEKIEKKVIDYKVNKYCQEKTKMLIKELDTCLKMV